MLILMNQSTGIIPEIAFDLLMYFVFIRHIFPKKLVMGGIANGNSLALMANTSLHSLVRSFHELIDLLWKRGKR